MNMNWDYMALPACFALGLIIGLSASSHFKVDVGGNEPVITDMERRVQKLEGIATQKASEVARLSGFAGTTNSREEGNSEGLELEETFGRWLEQIESLKAYLRQVPSFAIPEMAYLSPRDWMDATKGKVLDTDADVRRTFAELRNKAKIIAGQKMSVALRSAAAMVGSGATPPEDVILQALKTAVGEEILQRYKLFSVPAGVEQTLGDNEWILRENVTADPIWDNRYTVASDGSISCEPLNLPILTQMAVAMEKYRKEHGISAKTLAELGYTPSSADDHAISAGIIEASKTKVRERN